MTKEDRWAIIAKWSEVENPSINDVKHFIDECVRDELMYAGLKAWYGKLDTREEFEKVLQAYSFDGYEPSQNICNYIQHYSLYPELAAMQHVDLNDCVSYIGEYYDGTPTSKYRKEGRYKVEPITDYGALDKDSAKKQ